MKGSPQGEWEKSYYARSTTSRAVPRPGAELSRKPPPIDAARARMFFRPWPGRDLLLVEAGAVVHDRDEALAGALLDPHLGPTGLACLRAFGEPFLHDPEDLDLLVGREPDPVLDLEVDLEPAVGGEEVDVPAQRASRTARSRRPTRARAPRTAPPAARPRRPPSAAAASSPGRRRSASMLACVETAKQVLREPVVDLARDARPLLRDGAAELGVADRAPRRPRAGRCTRAAAGSRPARRSRSRAAA